MDKSIKSSYNRWTPVIAGIAIQLCLGTAYIWGVFQPEVIKLLKYNNQDAGMTFALLLGVLTFGSTIGGLIQAKFSPKPVLIIGGLTLALGFFLASFATAEPWTLWVTYGIIGGFGMGITYTTTISVCQKWFPDKRGLITGLIVSALGFGGLVFTPIANSLIASTGVLHTFGWLSLIFIIVTVAGAMFIKNPPVDYKPEGWTPPAKKESAIHVQDFTPLQVLKTPQFYMVTVALMLATAAGLMVINYAKTLGLEKGLTVAVATSGVMVISAFNSFGRLFWGWTSDRLGRRNTLLLLLLLAGTTILFVNMASSSLILVLIAIVGFSYGGFLGVFPALTADFWGVKNVGVNYGMVLLGFGAGAVISLRFAGYFKDLTGGLVVPFIAASIAAYAGAVLIFLLRNPKLKS